MLNIIGWAHECYMIIIITQYIYDYKPKSVILMLRIIFETTDPITLRVLVLLCKFFFFVIVGFIVLILGYHFVCYILYIFTIWYFYN